MKLRFTAALAIVLTVLPAWAQDIAEVGGNWIVDLRFSPEAPASSTTMNLVVAADGQLTGSFYGSAIEQGRAVESNGQRCFAFRTSDASGPYHHSGCLEGSSLKGITWAEGRHFLLAWTASKDVSHDQQ